MIVAAQPGEGLGLRLQQDCLAAVRANEPAERIVCDPVVRSDDQAREASAARMLEIEYVVEAEIQVSASGGNEKWPASFQPIAAELEIRGDSALRGQAPEDCWLLAV